MTTEWSSAQALTDTELWAEYDFSFRFRPHSNYHAKLLRHLVAEMFRRFG